MPGWEAATRVCDTQSACDGTIPTASRYLIVTYPILLRPSTSASDHRILRRDAQACWDRAAALGVAGEMAAHVSRQVDFDGLEIVSVEETLLPPNAALCLAHAAQRHLLEANQWFWFHSLGD